MAGLCHHRPDLGPADLTEPDRGLIFIDDRVGNVAQLRSLIDNAAGQEHQIALLWQAIAQLSECVKNGDCVPKDAAREECFEADKLNQLVGK